MKQRIAAALLTVLFVSVTAGTLYAQSGSRTLNLINGTDRIVWITVANQSRINPSQATWNYMPPGSSLGAWVVYPGQFVFLAFDRDGNPPLTDYYFFELFNRPGVIWQGVIRPHQRAMMIDWE